MSNKSVQKMLLLKVGIYSGTISGALVGLAFLVNGKDLKYLPLWLIVSLLFFGLLGYLFIIAIDEFCVDLGVNPRDFISKQNKDQVKKNINYNDNKYAGVPVEGIGINNGETFTKQKQNIIGSEKPQDDIKPFDFAEITARNDSGSEV